MEAVVAVDGGGSKTDIAVLATTGALLARTRVGVYAQHVIGLQQSVERLDVAVRQLLDEAGNPAVVSAAVCFSDIDFPFEVQAYTQQLRQHPWAKGHLYVDNDTFAVLRVGTSAPTAVASVCGTGTNCVGRTGDGQVVRFAALGEVSGDWGGGADLGMAAIWHAARAADGRGPATAFQTMVPASFGLTSMEQVILRFHAGQLTDEMAAQLAPLVFQAAQAGDQIAVSLVERQADEIVAFATAAMRRLRVGRCPVVLGGGVVGAKNPLLLAAIGRRLAEQAPGAEMIVVTQPPIIGAALLAFDALGADADILNRVRQELVAAPIDD